MGSKRRVAIWYVRKKNEYVILDYPGKPKNFDCVFHSQNDMMEFARASGLVLKERVVQYVRNNHDRGGLRRMDMDRL